MSPPPPLRVTSKNELPPSKLCGGELCDIWLIFSILPQGQFRSCIAKFFIWTCFFFYYGNADIPKFGKLHFCWYLIKWSIYGRETSGCLVTWVYHNTNLNKNKKTLNKKEIDAKVTLFTSGFSIFSKFKKYSPKPFFRQPFGQWAFENVMGYSRNGGPWKDMDANVTVTVNLFFC